MNRLTTLWLLIRSHNVNRAGISKIYTWRTYGLHLSYKLFLISQQLVGKWFKNELLQFSNAINSKKSITKYYRRKIKTLHLESYSFFWWSTCCTKSNDNRFATTTDRTLQCSWYANFWISSANKAPLKLFCSYRERKQKMMNFNNHRFERHVYLMAVVNINLKVIFSY